MNGSGRRQANAPAITRPRDRRARVGVRCSGNSSVSVTIDTLSVTELELTLRELHEGNRTWVPILRSLRYAWRSAAYSTTSSATTPTPPAPRRPHDARARRPPRSCSSACSGGADSMALASALAFEAPKLGIRAGGVTVDHGLQPGSDLRAAEVAARLTALAPRPRRVRSPSPSAATAAPRPPPATPATPPSTTPPNAHGAAAVLLGHTRDDQAETVLLGLARGSGTRSLSGMAAVSGPAGRYRRPFLQLDRQTARKACLVQSLPVWDDPHNADPAYTRSRLRHEGLPALEKALGKGVVEALARTAQLSRDDADALDTWAAERRSADRPGRRRACLELRQAVRPAARRTPPGPAPRRHRRRCARRFALRPAHRGSRPADHRLARPGGHQPARPGRGPAAGWQTGHSARLTGAAETVQLNVRLPGAAGRRQPGPTDRK